MGRSRIDWNVPAQAFLGAYRESGNKFLDFRLTQEEQRKTSDKAEAKTVIDQMKIMATGGGPGGYSRAQKWARTQLGGLSSDASRKRVERSIETLGVLSTEEGIRAKDLFTRGEATLETELGGMGRVPSTLTGLETFGKTARGIGARSATIAPSPWMDPSWPGAIVEPGTTGGGVYSKAQERAAAAEELHSIISTRNNQTKIDVDDAPNIKRAFRLAGGVEENWPRYVNEINVRDIATRTANAARIASTPGGLLRLSEMGALENIDPQIADLYVTLISEETKAKGDKAYNTALSELYTGIRVGRDLENQALVIEAVERFKDKNPKVAEQLMLNITTLTHGAKNTLESVLAKYEKELFSGNIKGLWDEKAQEYGPVTDKSVAKDRANIVKWHKLIHPNQYPSGAEIESGEKSAFEAAAKVMRNIGSITNAAEREAEARRIGTRLSTKAEPGVLDALTRRPDLQLLASTDPEVYTALMQKPLADPFRPYSGSVYPGETGATVTPSGERTTPSAPNQQQPIGQMIGEQWIRPIPGVVARQGIEQIGSIPAGIDKVKAGADALAQFGKNVIEGATGTDPEKWLKTEDEKVREFWSGGKDDLSSWLDRAEGFQFVRREEITQLRELGYSRSDLEALSYSDIKDILANKTPRPQAR